jgi:hypothetical protein
MVVPLRIDEKVGQCNRKCSRSSSVSVIHKGQVISPERFILHKYFCRGIVLIMLNDTFWNYVNEIQSICMDSDPTNQNFSRKYGSITRDRLLLDVTNKSSLDLFHPCPLYIRGKSFPQRDSFYTNIFVEV